MNAMTAILKRELKGYFTSPVAYIFLVVFVVLCANSTFQESYYEAGNANLRPLFSVLPGLFALLAPAIAMRMWAEERRTGTIELLLTLPVTVPQAVLGKFLAGWLFFMIGLLLTLPIYWTVMWLGIPEGGSLFDADFGPAGGPVFTGYFGAALMAASYLAISCFFSAITRSQVISFVLALVACWIFVGIGNPSVLGMMPEGLSSFLGSLSFMTHYDTMQRGVIELRNVVFMLVITAGFLVACNVMLNERKAQ